MPETLFDLLEGQVRARGGHTALIDGDEACTYAELYARAVGKATDLAGAGVKGGDQVLLLVPLGIEFFVVFLALMRLGAAAVLIDPAMPLKSLRACLRNVRPDVLIGVPKAHLYRLIPEVGAIPLALGVGGKRPFAYPIQTCSLDFAGADPQSPALLTFTSGSTGTPKTIVRSHAFLLRQHEALQPVLKPRAGDIELSTLPVFILSNIGSGITSVLPLKGYARPDRMPAGRMIAYMRSTGVNRLLAAPAFCRRLCDEAARRNMPLAGLKRIFTGGGPVFPNLLNDLKQAAPEAEIMMVYGSSEAEPIAHSLADAVSADDLAITANGGGLLAGRPVDAVRLAIIADGAALPTSMDRAGFDALTLPPGQAGEIVVTGDHVVKTYLDGTGDTETKFRVDDTVWHRTGDAGYVDADGRLWLLGRCSARLTTDDGVFYPFSLEAGAMAFPGVRRAAAVGNDQGFILALEAEAPLTAAARAGLHQQWPCLAAIRYLRRIPVDRRHQSKVLFPELRRRLGV